MSIEHLIIGPASIERNASEFFISGDLTPSNVRAMVADLHESSATWPITVCTFSPVVIRAVMTLPSWQEDPDPFTKVTLRTWNCQDTPLLSGDRDRDYFAHFNLETLYLHGEFDDVLDS